MSQDTLGVLDHFSLGVTKMQPAVTSLYEGDKLTGKTLWGADRTRWQVAIQLI
jgi:hypothetical protein